MAAEYPSDSSRAASSRPAASCGPGRGWPRRSHPRARGPCRSAEPRLPVCAPRREPGRGDSGWRWGRRGERRLHHVRQLVLVGRRHQHHLRNAAQIGDVEEAVVRGAVIAGEPGAIHAEQNRQLLQRHIVNDGVKGALEECGVNGADRAKAARGHSSREDHGMFFGDSHIDSSAWDGAGGNDRGRCRWAWRR